MLKEWMSTQGIGPRKAGRILDVDHAQVSRIVQGTRSPGLTLALRIRDEAGIPVDVWRKEDRP